MSVSTIPGKWIKRGANYHFKHNTLAYTAVIEPVKRDPRYRWKMVIHGQFSGYTETLAAAKHKIESDARHPY